MTQFHGFLYSQKRYYASFRSLCRLLMLSFILDRFNAFCTNPIVVVFSNSEYFMISACNAARNNPNFSGSIDQKHNQPSSFFIPCRPYISMKKLTSFSVQHSQRSSPDRSISLDLSGMIGFPVQFSSINS